MNLIKIKISLNGQHEDTRIMFLAKSLIAALEYTL